MQMVGKARASAFGAPMLMFIIVVLGCEENHDSFFPDPARYNSTLQNHRLIFIIPLLCDRIVSVNRNAKQLTRAIPQNLIFITAI